MSEIVKWTTPSITYTFSVVRVSEITEAKLTITHRTGQIIKTLSDAEVGQSTLTWTLTQEETGALHNYVSIMLNYLLQDGTRGASEKSRVLIVGNDYNEVI